MGTCCPKVCRLPAEVGASGLATDCRCSCGLRTSAPGRESYSSNLRSRSAAFSRRRTRSRSASAASRLSCLAASFAVRTRSRARRCSSRPAASEPTTTSSISRSKCACSLLYSVYTWLQKATILSRPEMQPPHLSSV
eukprot:6173758-Pleurochrysis_carterae.AAC.3